MPDPIGSQFGVAVDEVTYGAELRDAVSILEADPHVVVYLDGPRAYELTKNDGEVRVSVPLSAGKQFAMTFEMPKDAAGKMITEMLAKKGLGTTAYPSSSWITTSSTTPSPGGVAACAPMATAGAVAGP